MIKGKNRYQGDGKNGGVSLGTATNAQGWFTIDLPVTKGGGVFFRGI